MYNNTLRTDASEASFERFRPSDGARKAVELACRYYKECKDERAAACYLLTALRFFREPQELDKRHVQYFEDYAYRETGVKFYINEAEIAMGSLLNHVVIKRIQGVHVYLRSNTSEQLRGKMHQLPEHLKPLTKSGPEFSVTGFIMSDMYSGNEAESMALVELAKHGEPSPAAAADTRTSLQRMGVGVRALWGGLKVVIGAPSEGDELTSSNEEYGKQKLRDLIELLYAPQLAIGLKLLKGKDHTLVREKILDDGAWVDFCRMGVIAAQSFADISSHQKEPEMATKVTYHILGQEKLAPPQQALPDAPQQKTITGGAGPSSNPTSITDRRLMNISNEQDHSPK